jgi:hypothetical protein
MAVFDGGCPAGLLYSDFVDFSAPDLSDAQIIKVRRYRATQSDTLLKYFLHDGPIIPSSIILRWEIIEDVGQFNETYRIGEDTELFLRVAKRWTFQHVADALVYKRRHGANLTRRLDTFLPVVERLTAECIKRWPEFAPFARRRMARIYAKAGNDCVALNEKRRAASFLLRAIMFNPLSWRVYVYLFLWTLPRGIEPSVRRAAKQLFYRDSAKDSLVEGS